MSIHLRRVKKRFLLGNKMVLIFSDSKSNKLFPYGVRCQNNPKRSFDKNLPMTKKKEIIARENRADIRHRKIVTSKKELGMAIENANIAFKGDLRTIKYLITAFSIMSWFHRCKSIWWTTEKILLEKMEA